MSKCLSCGYNITWAEQRRQFARVIKDYGVPPEIAKQLLPRCQRCVTRMLRSRPGGWVTAVGEIGEVGDLTQDINPLVYI